MLPKTGSQKGIEQPERSRPLKDLLKWAKAELSELGAEEAQASAEWLLAEVGGFDRNQLALEADRLIPIKDEKRYRAFVEKRKQRMPFSYIVGKAYFRDEVLEINPDCLIPRSETELLIDKFIEKSSWEFKDAFHFLDLCSGSGAITVSLLRKYSQAKATLADVSAKALEIARKNCQRYNLEIRAEFIESDLFEKLADRKWDAIVCNPPYLSKEDFDNAQPEILFEPKLALAGGEDGYDFYRRVINEARKHLNEKGLLFFELGLGQSTQVEKWLKEKSFNRIEIYKDHSGIERMIKAENS